MTRELGAILDRVLDDLSIDDADGTYATAIDRAQRYALTLANDRSLGVINTRIGGSIGKRTALYGLSDVDLYVYMERDCWTRVGRNQMLLPSTILNRMRARIKTRLAFELMNRYARVRAQTHSVGVRFRKRGSVGIDIVPALVDGANVADAWVPRKSVDEFVETSIERQVQVIESLDTPFKPLRRGIRLLKIWNMQSGAPLHSYAVEVLGMHAVTSGSKRTAAQIFLWVLDHVATSRLRDPITVEHFYRYRLATRRTCVIYDPAMPDNNLGAHLSASHADVIATAAGYTLRKLERAQEYLERGRDDVAERIVSEAFGRASDPVWEP